MCSEVECINVTAPIQALVNNSELRLMGKTNFVSYKHFTTNCLLGTWWYISGSHITGKYTKVMVLQSCVI